jgi:hypothetical protein
MTTSTNTPELTKSRAARKARHSPLLLSHRPKDGHPLTWWRILPPHLLGEAERLRVDEALNGLAVFGGGQDLAAALNGDPAAAISVTLSLVPLRAVTLKADIAMTALLSYALHGDSAAVLVLSHILGRAQWEDPRAVNLGVAWLDRHIAHPMDAERFAANEAALAAAFARKEI